MTATRALPLLFALLAAPAWAEPATSAYTEFDTRSCKHVRGRQVEDYGSWTCRGLPGWPIRLAAGDQRMFVSFGAAGPGDLAIEQTFPGFNDVYTGRVEWRSQGKRPVATILRWNVMTASDSEKARGPTKPSGRVLVITRVGAGGTCHVGYVDARANRNANQLARQIADETAPGFRCGTDRAIVKGDVTPGLAMPSGS